MDKLRRKQLAFSGLYLVIAILFMWALRAWTPELPRPKLIPYSEFVQLVNTDKVEQAEVREEEIVASLKHDKNTQPSLVVTRRLPRIDESPLLGQMERHGVAFAGHIEHTSWWQSFLAGWLLPMGFMVGIYFLVMRRVSARGGPLSIGRNRAKIYDENASEKVSFTDVAGVDEAKAELVEIVEFLKRPEKYQLLGARIPKGVLLVGAPGTGKTLLARAVAGEAGVPFFSLSGSEFIEMFVGLGAARMRDLFEQAKTRAPCIVFIDELDAIGKSRGGLAALATHDEREHTLNQLLSE